MDFTIKPAPHIKGGHTWLAFNPIFDLIINDTPHLYRVHVTGGPKDEYGKTGKVILPQPRPIHIIRKARDEAVQPITNIICRCVQICAPGEAYADPAGALC